VNQAEGKRRNELSALLTRDCGVSQSALSAILDSLEAIQQSSSGQAAAA